MTPVPKPEPTVKVRKPLRQRTPLPKATKPIARSGRPKARNPKRAAKNWTRAHESLERVEWVKRQPSVVSGKGPCVNAHVKTGGGSRKADARFIVPVTQAEHDEMHHGQKSFEQKHGVDLLALAAWTEARWQDYLSTQGVTA